MTLLGWGVVSASGDSHSGLLYEKKEDADKHCKDWNKDERLGDYRPYRPVGLFMLDKEIQK